MSHRSLVVLALVVLPTISLAQTDTTRRRDTTRTPSPQDTARRVQQQSRGEIDLSRAGVRFSPDQPNYGMSTDQEGNFYVAEVNNGRIQKYRPRPGANPAFLVGKPWKGVW